MAREARGIKKKSQRIDILSDEKDKVNFEVEDAVFRAPPCARLQINNILSDEGKIMF